MWVRLALTSAGKKCSLECVVLIMIVMIPSDDARILLAERNYIVDTASEWTDKTFEK